jgi:mycothiol synthase
VLIIPYDARYCEGARLAQNDAFVDEPHGRLLDAQDWPKYAVGLATFLPDASFLALAGPAESQDQQVVAFLLSLEHGRLEHGRLEHGRQTGNQDQMGGRGATLLSLGTRRGWRGQGLATTLIGHAVTAYRQAGFSTARLQVCSHNTSAVGLYTGLGFTNSDRGYAVLQGPIPSVRDLSATQR